MQNTKTIKLGKIKIGGGNPFVLIAGPCVIESEKSVMEHAEKLKKVTGKLKVPFIFKASYDKANRTSVNSYRGPGIEKGLKMLEKVKKAFDIPILSDVHSVEEANLGGNVLDIIQIPAFLCRQTDIVVAAGKTGKIVNVKKGQFLAPWDMENVIKKIESTSNKQIIITDRGVSFGYNNLVTDLKALIIMKDYGYPVCFDATHSVQKPGALGGKSGGDSKFIPYLSKAALCCGADVLFMEVHKDPSKALSDGANMLKLSELESVLKSLQNVEKACKG
ncbi:MAG: 3-deoxy-8-phosphooctulonate synthase [Candidatus Omnitrophica bacterium]|nr:3-deoxy-8-phosphooctulonate synthase [Candidatus Omnitrophota bacterium]